MLGELYGALLGMERYDAGYAVLLVPGPRPYAEQDRPHRVRLPKP